MKKTMLLPIGRCNKCMRYYHEEVDECLYCMSDKYLMDMPEIVKAVNMHDELVSTLEEVKAYLERISCNIPLEEQDSCEIAELILETLDKAKGA